MKPRRRHPKLRKTVKWGGLAVTVLLVAMWAISTRYVAFFGPVGKLGVQLDSGLIGLVHYGHLPSLKPRPLFDGEPHSFVMFRCLASH